LREAKEEIGLAPSLIEPLGYLDLYLTFSGFRILPTVARVQPDFALTLNPREVTETFEVPLAFLMTPANHQLRSRDWKGINREYYAMPFGDRYIWGITAGIVRNLYDRVYA
jgi:8-oxo-dGTP pyrophosphatase MutT (NUDIX family)